MSGIIGYSAYVPCHRLDRSAISATLGVPPAKGTRSVASYDEDATTMAVAAARSLRVPPDLDALYLTSTNPPYLDKTNATAVHAALDLDPAVGAFDMMGSVRSTIGALRAGLAAPVPTLVIGSDLRTGLPGSEDERDGGDAAAALLLGPGSDEAPVLAEYLGGGAATGEFLERWRLPGERASRLWEERFGVHAFLPLAGEALPRALAAAGVAPDAIDHVIVTGTHARAARVLVRMGGLDAEKLVDDLAATVGNTGAAHPALLLASALDEAGPGETIALIVLADGVDALLFRTTDALPEHRATVPLAQQAAAARSGLPYPTFLTWRGFLNRQPPRRPDPQKPAAPAALRREPWKFAFTAARCTRCGMLHLPPARVCLKCKAVDAMQPERLADRLGTIATFTVDRLAFSPSPPVIAAVIDFDGGGRFRFELTDAEPDSVAIGGRVQMTFRRINTAEGVHNYFWKARPAESAVAEAAGSEGA